MSVGFFETHRSFFAPSSVRDRVYSLPPPFLPDTPEIREDVAAYKASARSLDHGVGSVLNALQRPRLDERTLVIFTTDHGLAFPTAKASLLDRGIGVSLIMRGPGFTGGRAARRARLPSRHLPDGLRGGRRADAAMGAAVTRCCRWSPARSGPGSARRSSPS